jgi:hypothetical protein
MSAKLMTRKQLRHAQVRRGGIVAEAVKSRCSRLFG